MSFATRFVVTLLVSSAAAIAQADGEVPALTVTAPNGASSLLVGSMHVPFDGLRQPSPSILQGRRRLVVESVVTEGPQPSAQSLDDVLAPNALETLRTTGKLGRASWAASLGDGEIAELVRNGSCLKPPADSRFVEFALAMKSAEAAAALAYWRCGKPGQLSRDEIVGRAASTYGVPVQTLETQVAVDRQRKAVPYRIYEEQLRKAFTQESRRAYPKVVDALNSGDYAAVMRIISSGYRNPSDAAVFNRIMVEERNLAWMPVLKGYLDEGNAVVLVGAAHLPGKQGIIALLKSAGYKVEPTAIPSERAQR